MRVWDSCWIDGTSMFITFRISVVEEKSSERCWVLWECEEPWKHDVRVWIMFINRGVWLYPALSGFLAVVPSYGRTCRCAT